MKLVSAVSLTSLFLIFSTVFVNAEEAATPHTNISTVQLEQISNKTIEEKATELEKKFKWAQSISQFGNYVALPAMSTYVLYLMGSGLYKWWYPQNANGHNLDPNNLDADEIAQVRALLNNHGGQHGAGWYAHVAQFSWFLFPIILQILIEYAQQFLSVFAAHDLGYYVMTYSSLPRIKEDFEYQSKHLQELLEQDDLNHTKNHVLEMVEQMIDDITGMIGFINATVSFAQIKKEPLLSKGLYIKRHTNKYIQQAKRLLNEYDQTVNIDEQRTLLRNILEKSSALLTTIENEIKTFTILVHKAQSLR